jgi:hypothetical protein
MEKDNITTDPAKLIELLLVAMVGGIISNTLIEEPFVVTIITVILLYLLLGGSSVTISFIFNEVLRNDNEEETIPEYWPPQRAS